MNETETAVKLCKKCGVVKAASNFNNNARYKDGFFPWCKPCMSAYRKSRNKDPEIIKKTKDRMSQYYLDNKERINENNNAWRNDPEYRERKNKQKEEIHERKFGVDEEWTEKYRLWRKMASRRRLATLAVTPGEFTKEDFVKICDKYGNVCLRCHKKKKLTTDHIIPVSKGGANDISNIQPLCKSCNSIKHDKTVDYRPYYEIE